MRRESERARGKQGGREREIARERESQGRTKRGRGGNEGGREEKKKREERRVYVYV